MYLHWHWWLVHECYEVTCINIYEHVNKLGPSSAKQENGSSLPHPSLLLAFLFTHLKLGVMH